MVRAGNDVYMVCKDAYAKSISVLDGLKDGTITRGELQRCVKNILMWITKTPTFESYVARGCTPRYPLTVETNNLDQIVAYLNDIVPGQSYRTPVSGGKKAAIDFQVCSNSDILSQNPVNFKMGDIDITFNVPGGNKTIVTERRVVDIPEGNDTTAVFTFPDCIEVKIVRIKQ